MLKTSIGGVRPKASSKPSTNRQPRSARRVRRLLARSGEVQTYLNGEQLEEGTFSPASCAAINPSALQGIAARDSHDERVASSDRWSRSIEPRRLFRGSRERAGLMKQSPRVELMRLGCY